MSFFVPESGSYNDNHGNPDSQQCGSDPGVDGMLVLGEINGGVRCVGGDGRSGFGFWMPAPPPSTPIATSDAIRRVMSSYT